MKDLSNNYTLPTQQWLFTIYNITVPHYLIKTLGFPEIYTKAKEKKMKGLGKCLTNKALSFLLLKIRKVKIKHKQKMHYYENAKSF